MRRKRLLWQIYPYYVVIALIALAAIAWYASTALRDVYIARIEGDLHARATLLEKTVYGGGGGGAL